MTTTTEKLAQALQPFVLANSSEEYVILIVRSSDITKAREALAAHEADKQAGRDSAQAVPEGFVLVPVEQLEILHGKVNTLATLRSTSDRYTFGGRVKASISELIAAAPKGD